MKRTDKLRADKERCETLLGAFDETTGECTRHVTRTFTSADLDQDGTPDITESNCQDAGGEWSGNQCAMEFPASEQQYGPDFPEVPTPPTDDHPDSPWVSRPDHKIVWYDAPDALFVDNGDESLLHLVSYVRGTDDKYCYEKFRIDLEARPGPDHALLRHGDRQNSVDSIPGVP